MLFITVESENSQLYQTIVNSGLKNARKIIRILYFLSNADVSNKFAKFQCFDKDR